MGFRIIFPVLAAALAFSLATCRSMTDRKADMESAREEALIYAYVNGEKLTIQPAENSSAEAFLALLGQKDLTVDMRDYGGFEKVGSLETALPANDERITAQPGDVILYQGNSITIYYDTNTWSFTRLGKVQDLTQEELLAILGDGEATVTFSLDGGKT